MLYIFDKDDNFKNIITEDTGLIDTWFKDYQNHLIDEPFVFHVDSESELLPLIVAENQVAFKHTFNALQQDVEMLKLLRIKEIDEVYNNDGYIVEVTCEPSWLELYDHFIEDRRIENGTSQTAMNRALQGSRWVGQVAGEFGNGSTNFYWIDAVEALFKIAEEWGGTLQDYITLDENNEIATRIMYLLPRLGRDNGLLIQPGYNAETVERRTLSYPVTAIWGQGASLEIEDEEGNHTGGYTRYITFEDVEWSKAKGDPVDKPKGQKWVGDPDALAKYGYKQVEKVYLLDYTTLEIGTLTSNTGNETSAPGNNRIRSGFIDFVESPDIVIDAIPSTDIQINVYSYDSSERFISHSNYLNLSNNIEYTLPVNARYVRFVFKTINNEIITVSNIRDISIRFNFFDIMHRFGHFSNQDYETPEELLWATWEALQKEKEPEVYHEAVIDEVDKPIFLGDTGTILDRHYGKPIEVQSQITGLEYDILRPMENVKTVLGNYKDMSRDPLEDEIDEIKKEQSRPPIINDNSFPDVKPGTPVNVEAAGMFRAILVSWEYDSKIYISHYEVYASQTADFVPDAQFLVYRGRVSSFGHEVGSNETWYYRVRAVNTHGTTSEFSVQVSASSTRIDFIDLEDEIKQEIQDTKNRAEEAYGNANIATENAMDAIDKAQQGFDKAQDAITQAGTANTKADQSLSQAQSAFNKAQESLDGLSTLVGITDEQGKELTSIKGSVQGLQASVTDLDDNVATLQMTSQSLAGRLTDAEGNLTTVSATVKGLQTQVSDVEGNVSTVTQLANVLERRMTDSEGNINSLQSTASSLSSRIGLIENWEIGGRNLLRDTALNHEGLGAWNVLPTVHHDELYPYVQQNYGWGVRQIIPLLRAGTYTISTLVKVSGTTDAKMRWSMTGVNGIKTLDKTTDWQYVSYTFSLDADVKNFSIYFLNNDTVGNERIKMTQFKLEKGNKATDWTPAPEDTDQKFSAIDQTIDSISTRVQTNTDNYSSMTQTVQGIQSTVANKADKSTVTQLAGVVDTKISTVDANNKFATQSQLTQTASSLTSTITSVRNDLEGLEISETNLVLNSNTKVNGTAYRITGYDLTLDWVAGEEWTVVIKGEINEGQRFGIWANGSSAQQVYVTNLGNGYHRATFTVKKPTVGGTNAGEKIMNVYNYPSATAQSAFIEWVKLVRAEKTSLSWSPAPEDMATQSQISQLSDAINLRVKEDELITQINLDKSGVLISGKKLILDGDTTVTGNFRVNNANIVSVDAGKMTTGTLDAARVNVININANNITSGTVDTDLLTVRGGSATDYTMIRGSHLTARGTFKQTWKGKTNTYDIRTMLQDGYLRFRNDSEQSSLYYSWYGISTYVDGEGGDEGDRGTTSGSIYWWDKTYSKASPKTPGITVYSYGGTATLESDRHHALVKSRYSTDIESTESNITFTPFSNDTKRGFKFTKSADRLQGYLLFGDTDETGLRFTNSNDGIVQVVDVNNQTGGNTEIEAGYGRFNTIRRRSGSNYLNLQNPNYMMIGLDNSGSARIASNVIYRRTYSSGANVHITGEDTLGRSTSARKYKRDIEPITKEYAYNFFNNVTPIFYRPYNTNDENMDHSHYGYIADDVAPIEPRLVQFRDGEPESFSYDRVPTLLHVVMKNEVKRIDEIEKVLSNHDDELTILREQYEQAIFKIANLEERIIELESAA